jgi:hypothetical protein
LNAQGIKGKITNKAGEPLPFATVYIENLQTGTASNGEGDYQIKLPRGRHSIVYQYLGYETQSRVINVSGSFENIDIQLAVEPIQLQEAIVSSDREDAAYTIMRKAIAKAKFHTQQIDAYDATVYLKGSGRLLKTPSLIFFKKKIEKALKEEGIDSTTAFVTESVSEVHYERPNTYTEKVISVRTVGDDNNSSPNAFVQSSFYEPRVNGAVSPLSPKAFAHYRFEYLGNFSDRGHLINKIKVTPRSRGDQIFEGFIYIVDQEWAIHSLDLFTYIWGIRFNINQVYAPIEENAWMPINQIFDVTGSVFGFKFEYRYLANVQDYDITLNPDLVVELTVIDDKLEKDLAKKADRQLKNENFETLSELESGKEVSRKQLRKLMKEYEKMEMEELTEKIDTLTDVQSITSYEVDSMAYKRDSTYWSTVRPLPLTRYEVKGYHKMDSMAIASAQEEAAKDSVTVTIGSDGVSTQRLRKKSKFDLKDLVLGGSYKMGERSRFTIEGIPDNLHFNTVDGYNMKYLFRFSGTAKSKLNWSISPGVRYAFSRKAFGYELSNAFSWGKKRHRSSLLVGGGRDISQLSRNTAIHPYVNDFMSILFERNYMKVYEKDYVIAKWGKNYGPKLTISLQGEWEKRRPQVNYSDFVLFESNRRSYTSNIPYNSEIGDTSFPEHNAFTTSFRVETKPWLKYSIRNNRKRVIDDSSPTIHFQLNSGWNGVGNSQTDYQQVELGIRHQLRIGIAGDLTFSITGGTFLKDDQVYFPDFKHFPANKTPFATLDPVASYRMLDYYSFSTESAYLSSFVHYQFRKFLVTQIPIVRLTGIREGFYLNSLESASSNHYMELGYNINYIFRLFRLEAVTSWQDFKYQNFGIRVGIATNLDDLFR